MGCYVIAKRKPGTAIFEFEMDSHIVKDEEDELYVYGSIEAGATWLEAFVEKYGKDNVMLLRIMNVDVKVQAYARVQNEMGNTIYEHEGYKEAEERTDG